MHLLMVRHCLSKAARLRLHQVYQELLELYHLQVRADLARAGVADVVEAEDVDIEGNSSYNSKPGILVLHSGQNWFVTLLARIV